MQQTANHHRTLILVFVYLLISQSYSSSEAPSKPRKNRIISAPENLRQKIEFIEQKIKSIKGTAGKFITDSKLRKRLIKRIGKSYADKFERRIQKMEKRVLREKSILLKELDRLEGQVSELPLNDFVEFVFYVFSDDKSEETRIGHEAETEDEILGQTKFWKGVSKFMKELDSERMSEPRDEPSKPLRDNHSIILKDKDMEENSMTNNDAKEADTRSADQRAKEFIRTRGDITKVLYEGIWTSHQKSQQGFLLAESGRFFALLSFTRSGAKFIFQVFEGKFIDSPTLAANFNLDGIPPYEFGFVAEKRTTVNREEQLFSEQGQIECQMRIEVSFLNKTSLEPLDLSSNEISSSKMVGSVHSEECMLDFIFEGEISIPDFFKALFFTIFQLIFLGIGIVPLHRMLHEERRNRCLDMSEWAVMLNIMVDVVLFIINLVFSMRVLIEYFEFLTVVTMFLLFSILFKFRFAIIAFNLRSINNTMDARRLSRKKMFFFLKMIGLGVLALSVGTLFIEFEFLFFVLFSYPLFQIWHNVNSVDKSNCFSFQVHPLIYFSQLLYPICLRGLPDSLFKLTPSPNFGTHLVVLVLAFLLFLSAQRLLGAAFFIPKSFVPGYHHYPRRLTTHSKFAKEMCPICFTALSCDPDSGQPVPSQDFLLTPCKHAFHAACLMSWMERKLACPSCRNKIPPVL